MRKLLMAAVAAALMLGLLAAPSGAVRTVRVQTNTFLDTYSVSQTQQVTVNGHITCGRQRCVPNRRVELRQLDTGQFAGADRTDSAGKFTIVFNGNNIPPGHFQAKATRRTYLRRRNGQVVRRLICKRDLSPVYVLSR